MGKNQNGMPIVALQSPEIDNDKVSSRICFLLNNHWINSMTLNNIIGNSVNIMIIIIHFRQLLDEKTVKCNL